MAGVKKVYLIVAKGKQKGFPVPITVDLFLIGSKDICQMRSKLEGIAEEHCAIVTRDFKVFVRDMDGGEPTVVNGTTIRPGVEWPLHPGDRVEVGPLEFVVQFHEKELSRRDLEEWASKSLDKATEKVFEDAPEEFQSKKNDASSAAAKIIEALSIKKGVVMGRLRIGRDQGITTVAFNDQHMVEEAEVSLISKELRDNLGRPQLRILLDFKNVKRISSAGAKMLAEFVEWLKQWGSTVAVCRIRPELQGMLTSLSTKRITIYKDKKIAMTAKW